MPSVFRVVGIEKIIERDKTQVERHIINLEAEFERNLSDLVSKRIGKKSYPVYDGNEFNSISHYSKVMDWKIKKDKGERCFIYINTRTSRSIEVGSSSNTETNGVYLPDLGWSLKMDFVTDIRDYSYFCDLDRTNLAASLQKKNCIPLELQSEENQRIIGDFVNNYLMVLNFAKDDLLTK